MSEIELRREALYEEVWETPVSRLAEQYGLSDVGLRKICKKLSVPTPPRGYWAKRQHGHEVERTPLPPPAEGAPEAHVIYRRASEEKEEGSGKGEPADEGEVAGPPTGIPEIRVAKRLRKPHPLIAKARDALKGNRPDRYGRVQSTEGIGVNVTPASTNRALRIMDALVKAAEQLGWPIEKGCGYLNEPCFLVEGEKVSFRLMEKVRQERRKAEDSYSWREWEYTYHPTGRLRLEITSSHGPRKKWTERKRGPGLEDLLGSFLEGVYKAAQAERKWTQMWEEKERRRKEKERRQREKERRKKEEEARRRALENEARSWRKSQELQAYIREVERRATGQDLTGEEQEAFERWHAWAREHAERLDPLFEGLPFKVHGRTDNSNRKK